jgi:hypothetical protein
MSTHRYAVSQRVHFSAPLVTASASAFEIVALVPPTEAGEPQYRIKCLAERHERLALERHIALMG